MKTKLSILLVFSVSALLAVAQEQESDEVILVQPAAKKAEKTQATPTNALPALEAKSYRIINNGVGFGSFTVLNDGAEYIGIHIPEDCRMRVDGGARQVIIYTDENSRNWVKMEFQPRNYADFTVENVLPRIGELLGASKYQLAKTRIMGTEALEFTSTSTSNAEQKQTKIYAVPCASGTLIISATAYGTESASLFPMLQRMVSSLQAARKAEDLVKPKPVLTS